MIRLGLRAEVQRNGPSISWRLATGLNKLKTGKPVQLPGAGLARVDTLPGVQQQGGALASREELLHEAHVDNAQVLNAVVGRGKVGGMCSDFWGGESVSSLSKPLCSNPSVTFYCLSLAWQVHKMNTDFGRWPSNICMRDTPPSTPPPKVAFFG